MFELLLSIPLILANPQLVMRWSTVAREALTFRVVQHDEFMNTCRESGSDVYYRYEYQLCKRRRSWLDGCGDFENETRTLSSDPISENYRIKYEKWGSDVPDMTAQFSTLDAAVEELSTVREVLLSELIEKSEYQEVPLERLYVRANARFICKAQRNTTMDNISRILTLGLVRHGTTESGWTDFYLVSR